MMRVLIVDDQVLIRAGLAALVRAAPGFEVVGEAADGEEALAQAASCHPDVILMDIRMPGVDGVMATERILAVDDQPPRVLILTTFDLDEYVYAALRAGASGFLLKDTPPGRLLTAISAVAVLSELTVKTHVNRIMTKLDLSSRAQAAVLAYETGLIIPQPRSRLAENRRDLGTDKTSWIE